MFLTVSISIIKERQLQKMSPEYRNHLFQVLLLSFFRAKIRIMDMIFLNIPVIATLTNISLIKQPL